MKDATARFELFATDVAALTEFLRDALNFETVRETPEYVEMRAGSVTISVGPISGLPTTRPLRPSAQERLGLGVEIVLETNDIDTWHDHLLSMGTPQPYHWAADHGGCGTSALWRPTGTTSGSHPGTSSVKRRYDTRSARTTRRLSY